MSYPFNVKKAADLTCTGTGGAALAQGDTVTGSAVRDIVIAHDTFKVTNEVPSPTGQEGAHHPYIKNAAGTWVRLLSQQYGDYFYFVQTVAAGADRAIVIEKTADVCEVQFHWDSFSISAASLTMYLPNGSTAIYPESSATTRKFGTVALVKRVRVVNGINGYFVGAESVPECAPGASVQVAAAEESTYGEQECGPGTGSAVTWSSNAVTARHPAAGTHVNLNIHSQTTGPWYFASIPADTDIPYVRYVVTRGRLSCRSYQFGGGDRGVAVVRHLHQVYRSGSVVPYRHQMFIGATYHVQDSSSSFANEPTSTIQSTISTLASNLSWPAL